MLTVYFKNVGQGDSIFLSWKGNDGETRHGLIDCTLVRGRITPIQSHLQQHDISRLEWIIISHPHTDHCSGVLPLLDFCESGQIEIGEILHTAQFSKEFLKATASLSRNRIIRSMVNVEEEATKLLNMYSKIFELHSNKTVPTKGGVIADRTTIDLNKDIRLKILAPTGYDELNDYLKRTFHAESGELMIPIKMQKRRNNPNANLLSSCILIESSNWQLLFPSDCITSTLKRIKVNSSVLLDKVRLVQIPHHGSKNGHSQEFLDSLPNKKEICAIVSVGNNSYGHPADDVIDYYYRHFKEVHATNFMGRMEEVQNDFGFFLDSVNALLFPENNQDYDPKNEIEFEGEKIFRIDHNGDWMVETIQA